MIEPTAEPAVEARGLTKRFGSKLAVGGLDLRIEKGTVFGFIGPNGAGKSTTIRMLMGLLPMNGGDATVMGIDVRQRPEAVRRCVGYVPEQHLIYRWMRVKEVLWFCRQLHEAWNESLARELCQQFELSGQTKVRHLSKGMLAKLALIIALAPEPELLILDEPMAGLDPIIREEFLETVLQSFCRGGRTIFFSTHMLGDIQRLADSVGIIHDGRLLVHGSVADLLSRTKRVRLALERDELPAELPQGVIRTWRNRRECVLTITDCDSQKVQHLEDAAQVRVVEVLDVGLEDIFKDYIKGQREAI